MFRISTLILFVLLSFSASAVPVKDLYSATAISESRSKESLKKAANEAFLRVLSKASGQSIAHISAEPRIAQDLKNPMTLVERFSYQVRKNKKDVDELWVKVTFSEKAVISVLQTGGLKLWPENRPATLILPVVQKNNHKVLIRRNHEDSFNLSSALTHYSMQYGLPIVTATKTNRNNLEGLWVFNHKTMEKAAGGIAHDTIFTARIAVVSSGRFIGAWFLKEKGKSYSVDVSAKNADEFVKKGFAWLAKHYSKQYALALVNDLSERQLILRSLNTQQDYDAAMKYLESHDLIRHVYLIEANTDHIKLSLALKTSVEQLSKAFELDNKMRVNEQDEITHIMDYSWR